MWRGWRLEWIVVLCAQRNSTTQRRSTLKRLLLQVISLSDTEGQPLGSFWTENILYKDYRRGSEGQVRGRRVGQPELSLK